MGMRASKFQFRGSIAVAGVVAVLSAASMAWACTYQPRIVGVTPQATERGGVVRMTAQGVAAAQAVEIRWNGTEGLKLAETRSDAVGNFSVDVAIPDVAPGVYSLVAVAGSNAVARAAFEVTGDVPASVAAHPTIASSTGFGPSLVDAAPARSSGTDPGFMAGMALLVAGSLALASGVAVAAVRRRRATAVSAD